MSLSWGICIILLSTPIAVVCSETKQTFRQCPKELKPGKELNLERLTGDWYPVYYWPKKFAPNECYKVTFKEVAHADAGPCRDKIPEGEKIIQSTFTTQQKTWTQYFYGAGEVTHFSMSVEIIKECVFVDAMWRDLGNGYTLVTACPIGANALMARNLTSSSELQVVVDSIDALKDTEGGSSCI
ncbi:uncharacterized protein LOC121733639 [Aricia agestis]|uniref:uncharacterized protein LOC121733639 n=1 Tax=Aricia agestis TaxID=91739 RepID=UPI001C2094D5|nr:uncharacterized protein LOC121733639 [Aricia agestis]